MSKQNGLSLAIRKSKEQQRKFDKMLDNLEKRHNNLNKGHNYMESGTII